MEGSHSGEAVALLMFVDLELVVEVKTTNLKISASQYEEPARLKIFF